MNFNVLNFIYNFNYNFNFNNIIIFTICTFHFVFLLINVIFYHYIFPVSFAWLFKIIL